jgi:hypothetical protein
MKTEANNHVNEELVMRRFYKNVVNGFGYEPDQQRFFNFSEQRALSEAEILEYIEAHFSGLTAERIYLGPGFYIEKEFYVEALKGMLKSFERKEEYELCNRIARLLFKTSYQNRAVLAKAS